MDDYLIAVPFFGIGAGLVFYFEIKPLLKAKKQGFNLTGLDKSKLFVRYLVFIALVLTVIFILITK